MSKYIKNDVDICDITADSPSTGLVTFEISSGGCTVSPVWDGAGKLAGLDVQANVGASVIEQNGNPVAGDSAELASLLEAAVSSQIDHALGLSKKLGVDFLGLAGQLDAAAPYRFRRMEESFGSLLPSLPVQVSVSGKLTHTSDVKGL